MNNVSVDQLRHEAREENDFLNAVVGKATQRERSQHLRSGFHAPALAEQYSELRRLNPALADAVAGALLRAAQQMERAATLAEDFVEDGFDKSKLPEPVWVDESSAERGYRLYCACLDFPDRSHRLRASFGTDTDGIAHWSFSGPGAEEGIGADVANEAVARASVTRIWQETAERVVRGLLTSTGQPHTAAGGA